MAIEEKAINTAVATLLTREHGLNTVPENRGDHGQPDLSTKIREDSKMCVVTEAKIGTDKSRKEQAIKDASNRLKTMPECQSAIALCYPAELAEADSMMQEKVEKTAKLEFVPVNEKGATDSWRTGSVADLAMAIKTAQEDHGASVSRRLKTAIKNATAITDDATAQRLAAELNLVDPKATAKDRKGAKIAFLIIVNTMLIQSRLHQVNAVKKLAALSEIQTGSNITNELQHSWELIKAVDYVPVVNPALAVLKQLGNSRASVKQLEILLQAARECESLVGDLRLDHAGPLYHSLLASAPFDGSFYTSTVAATILAHLVMPNDWTEKDWKNENKIAGLKVCDPACGTGTLLMATASALLERHRKAKGERNTHTDRVFGKIVENVLYGIDINQHAIHLAAAMLTVSAPKVDYNRLNIFRARHGVVGRRTFTGSLELLSKRKDWLVPEVAPQTQTQRVSAKGMTEESPDIQGEIDIVIMNPPFTRNDIRNRQYNKKVRKAVQNREVKIAKSTRDALHQEAIDNSALETFFTPIADVLTKQDTGAVGIVAPFTTCTAPAAKKKRKLLATRFQVEAVITSHDNRRIYFSENPNIHEFLIVARRRTKEEPPPAKFINLENNPATLNDAAAAAEAIRQAVNGSTEALAEWGTCKEWPHDRMAEGLWIPAVFYSDELADAAWSMQQEHGLKRLDSVAKAGPAGQAVRGTINKAKTTQTMRAFWNHETNVRTAMEGRPDNYITAKNGKSKQAANLWAQRGNLLIANKIRTNLVKTVAVWSKTKALGSAFIPVRPISTEDPEKLTKAWCVWFNSTPGLLAYMSIRQKTLHYPSFSLDNLRSLPVPTEKNHDIDLLAITFDRLKNEILKPLPNLETDEVRKELDKTMAQAIGTMDLQDIAEWRRLLAEESSIHQKNEPPFSLEP